jgi:hypothetical protein
MSTRWSYLVVEIKARLFGTTMTVRAQEELNRLGQQGWELVSSVQSEGTDCIRMFLKKPA